MKSTLVNIAAVMAIALAGCSAPQDSTPSEPTAGTSTESPVTKPTEAPTTDPEPQPEETTTAPSEPNPEPAPTVPNPQESAASTPATEFAMRWGKKYPNIPEFAILKAANRTCEALAIAPENWAESKLTVALLEEAVSAFGLQENDAVEFAQDAQQNYCPSIKNPT